jgi:carotenoid cleavage dioxygenase-like enzyme
MNIDDEDKWLSGDDRFLHLTDGICDRAKDFNRHVWSRTKLHRLPYENACYMHSGSITEDYLVLTEIPCHFNLYYTLWTILAGDPVLNMFKWNGETMPTYFRIISLETGEEVARIAHPAFFMFHHINSYQCPENKAIIVPLMTIELSTNFI